MSSDLHSSESEDQQVNSSNHLSPQIPPLVIKKKRKSNAELAAEAVANERDIVRNLKRLSIGGASTSFDPELAHGESSFENFVNKQNQKRSSLASTGGKRKSSQLSPLDFQQFDYSTPYSTSPTNSTHPSLPASPSTSSLVSSNSAEDSVLLLNHSTSISRRSSSRNYSLRHKNNVSSSPSTNNESVIDASKLLWVPATSHPGIAPENFRKHVQSTITEITQNLSSEETSDNNNLPQILVDESNGSTAPNNDYDNNNMPSLSDLTTELERLSTMAGLEATDAATLARTLSTSSISSFSNVNVGLSHSASPLSRDSSIHSSHESTDLPSNQSIQSPIGSLKKSSSFSKTPEEDTVNNNEVSDNVNTGMDDKNKSISLPGGDIKLRRSRWTTYRKRGNTIKRKQQSPPPLPSISSQSTADSSLTDTAAEKENLLNRRKRSQDLSKHPLPKLSQKLQELNNNNTINSKNIDVAENLSTTDSSVPKSVAPEQNLHDNDSSSSEKSKINVSHSMNISSPASNNITSPASNMGSPGRSIPGTPSTVSSSAAGSPMGSPSSNATGSPMSSKTAIMNHRREERERLKQERRKLEIQRLELEKEQKRLDELRKERLSKGNRAQHRQHISNGSPRYYEKSSNSSKVEGTDNSKIAEYPKSRRKYADSLDPKSSSSPIGAPTDPSPSSPSSISSSPSKGIGINVNPYNNTSVKESAQKHQQNPSSQFHQQQQFANQGHNHYQQGYNQQQKYPQKGFPNNNASNHKMQQQYVDADKSYPHHGRQNDYQYNLNQNRGSNNNVKLENRREDIFSGERKPQQNQHHSSHSNNLSQNNPDKAFQRADPRNDQYKRDNRYRPDNQSDISMSSKDASSNRGSISAPAAQALPSSNSLNSRSQSFSEGIDSGIGIGVNNSPSVKPFDLNRSSSERFSERSDLRANGETVTKNESNNDNRERPKFSRNRSFEKSQSDSTMSSTDEKFSMERKERPGLIHNNSSSNSIPKVKKNTFWSRTKNNNKDTESSASTNWGADKLNSENESDGDNRNNNYSKDNIDSSFSTQDSDQETNISSTSISTAATSVPESKKEKKMFGLFKRKSFKNLKSGTNKETDAKDQQKQQPNLPSNSKEQIYSAEKHDQNESGTYSTSGGYNSSMDVPSIDGKFGKEGAKGSANDYANNDSIFITDEEYNNKNNLGVKSYENSSNPPNSVAAAPNLNKGRFSVEQSQIRDPQEFESNLGTVNEPVIEIAEDGSNKMEVLSWLISADHLNTLEKLQLFKQIQGSENAKPNQPVQYTDSAFGFPLPPLTHSTIIMLDHRFPMNVERAIYRLSHLKLANPKRELRQQVLLSNFMYAYLNLVNHTLLLQNMEEGSAGVGGVVDGSNENMIEMDMSQAEASAIEL